MSTDALTKIRNASPAILPSLLMCDFGNLLGELDRLQQAGVEALHLDVMDGHFVPNLTYGMPIVEGIRRHTDLPLDVHLMISDPLRYAARFVDAGADLLTFHVEAVADPIEVATRIAKLGVAVGVAANPETPVEKLLELAPHCDLALVMSVNAGFGGQSFNPIALNKLRSLRERFPDLLLQIDGGISLQTIGLASQAGCDLFVVGSAIFGQPDYATAIRDLRDQLVS
ncbi:MAG: ribulose-phosphate 3-epimerase [Planctomycetaceae bacterium]|nr:MAG: ribulose-phosphate 3-epimerase [Planctomycetaceae bacterium]